ncbi:MAG: hemerythrin domain-containing protein [Terriglobia bacterium]|jgi:hemerythrin-like domain-containing protein|nr:hemerythrin domain-containing protein [Terriglobia bacterium]
MTNAMETLEREHRTIEKVLAVMARVQEQLDLKHDINAEILRDLLQFMRIFCDQYHQAREEGYLFPLLEERGIPATGCPIAVLKSEHGKILRLVNELSESTAAYLADGHSGRSNLKEALHNLMSFFPEHIWKEDYLLFPMAEKVLSPSDQEILLRQFALAELDLGGRINEEFEALAENLSERVECCPQCSNPQVA